METLTPRYAENAREDPSCEIYAQYLGCEPSRLLRSLAQLLMIRGRLDSHH